MSGEGHRALEKVPIGDRPRRVIRVVQPQHLRTAGYLLRDSIEVWQELVLLGQGHVIGLAARQRRPYSVHGVAGVGDEGHVAALDEAERDMPDSFLRTD